MKKISKNEITGFFIFLVGIVCLDPVFFRDNLTFKVFIYLVIILAAAYGTLKDTRLSEEKFRYVIFFAAALVLISAGQYVFSFFNPPWKGTNGSVYLRDELELGGSLLMAAGIGILIAGKLIFGNKAVPQAPEEDYNIKAERTAVALLFIIAFFLRIYKAGEIPPGIWFDEAQNGNEVMSIINGKPFEVFIPRHTQMPAMFFYPASFFVKVFGAEIISLRMVSMVLGSLSVVAFYFLARLIYRNWKLAFFAAFLMAVSRWHITFSRVAFLGMQTLFLEIIFFYFYIRAVNGGRAINAVVAGLVLGIAQYAFSASNFIVLIAGVHMAVLYISRNKLFKLKNGIIIAGTAMIILLPLLNYAVNNKDAFLRRAKDVSIMNEIEQKGTIAPLFKNIKTHFLMFNFEGDYNGRHNLYKKPLVTEISGVLLVMGFFLALVTRGNSLYILWFIFMLLGGILTITIESPQAYRTIGIIPVVYLLAGFAGAEIKKIMEIFTAKKAHVYILAAAVGAGALLINAHQYFVLYPANQCTFMSFSPVSNKIAEFINSKSGDYYVLVSSAENMYGFYMWEQKVICEFACRDKGEYGFMKDENSVSPEKLEQKKGVALLFRPSDVRDMARLEREYGTLKKETVSHELHYLDERGGRTIKMYVVYYIESDKIIKAQPGEKYFLYMRGEN